MGPVHDPEDYIVADSVNKAELVDRLAARLDVTKKLAGEALEAIVDEITQSVAKGDKVAISGFGVFEKADRAARVGRNPQTGATVKIKATSVPKFRAGAEFKAQADGLAAHAANVLSRCRAGRGWEKRSLPRRLRTGRPGFPPPAR